MSLFQELKRRNVFRVGIAYAVAGWLVLQLTDVLSELLNLPGTVGPIVVAVVAIGFPIALLFAWAYELTPDGVKRESEVDREVSLTRATGRTLDRAIIAMLVVVAGYFIWEARFAPKGIDLDSAPPGESLAGNEPATMAESNSAESGIPAPSVDPHSIAVLPFANRSRLEDDAFFVEGIHDDLLTNLARIGELKVISRTSVQRYAGTDMPIPAIAKELGVAVVMEGAVQRSGDTVRINVQLIDATTDEHLWAEIFDRQLTADNLFAIQTEISQQIADALETTLSPEETKRISDQPTENLVAYSAYLRGRQLLNLRTAESVEQAVIELENAVAEDPEFALAWATLAEAHWQTSNYSDALLKDSLSEVAAATERAIELNPELGLAWSWHAIMLSVNEEYDEAEVAHRRSLDLAPNNITVLRHWSDYQAYVAQRPIDALETLGRAIELDPFSTLLRASRADLFATARRFPQAASEYEAVIRMDPSFARAHMSYALLLSNHMYRFREAFDHASKAIELDPNNPGYQLTLHFMFKNIGAESRATEVRERLNSEWADHWSGPWLDAMERYMAGNFDGAIENIRVVESMFGIRPGAWGGFEADMYAAKGDWARAYQTLVEREPRVLQEESWDQFIPNNYWNTCGMSVILRRGGRETLGQDLAERTLAHILELNAQGGDPHRHELETCHAALGQGELALMALEQRLGDNHISSWWSLDHNYVLRPLKNDPRFRNAIDQVEARVAQERNRLESEGVL